jgi:hypothetical protein
MEKEIIIGILGLVGVYVLYKLLSGTSQEVVESDQYLDVLNDDKFKVKGQWDK